jgi:chromosome segregation ATPase
MEWCPFPDPVLVFWAARRLKWSELYLTCRQTQIFSPGKAAAAEMSNLRYEAAAVKRQIDSASSAVSNLQSRAESDIGNELGNLRNALTSSSGAIQGVLRKHKRRHFSLDLVKTQAQEAAALQRSINDIAGRLDVATQFAGRSHAQSESYYLKALDLPNTHIRPAKQSVQTLKGNIASAQYRLEGDLNSTKSLAADAQKELTRVRNDIAQKERNLQASRQKSQNNRNEINRLEREKASVERIRQEKISRASRLRAVS